MTWSKNQGSDLSTWPLHRAGLLESTGVGRLSLEGPAGPAPAHGGQCPWGEDTSPWGWHTYPTALVPRMLTVWGTKSPFPEDTSVSWVGLPPASSSQAICTKVISASWPFSNGPDGRRGTPGSPSPHGTGSHQKPRGQGLNLSPEVLWAEGTRHWRAQRKKFPGGRTHSAQSSIWVSVSSTRPLCQGSRGSKCPDQPLIPRELGDRTQDRGLLKAPKGGGCPPPRVMGQPEG